MNDEKKKLAELEARCAIYKAGLKFYADPNGIWAQRACSHGDTPTIDEENYPEEYKDPGREARKALREKETK